MRTKEEVGRDINDAGGWQEFFQKKSKNSTMEFYWTEKYRQFKKEYAKIAEREEVEKFASALKGL